MLRLLQISFMIFSLCGTAQAQSQGEMTFRMTGHPGNYVDAEWIAAEGRIVAETPDLLRDFIATHMQFISPQIVFHSPGGELGPALELGRIIRENEIRTAVGLSYNPDDPDAEYGDGTVIVEGTCESSCAWAFMGGIGRTVWNEDDWVTERIGRIGIHQFYSQGQFQREPAIVQSAMGELLFYLIEMGIDPGILALMSTVLPDEMHYLTREELSEYNVEISLGTIGLELALLGDGMAWYQRVNDNLGREVAFTYLYCVDGGREWVIWHQESQPTSYQGRAIYYMSQQDLETRYYEIQGQRIETQTNLGTVVGSSSEEGRPNYFVVGLGNRLTEFPGETLGFLLARNLDREVTGWRFPNMLRALPSSVEFNVLLRTCPTT